MNDMRERLGKAFAELRRMGYIARMNFLCCQSCAGYSIGTRIEQMRDAGKDVPGYVFFHKQDNEDFEKSGEVYLAYGDATTAKYETAAYTSQQVGEVICGVLRKYDLGVDWNGDDSQRILVAANQVALTSKVRS